MGEVGVVEVRGREEEMRREGGGMQRDNKNTAQEKGELGVEERWREE